MRDVRALGVMMAAVLALGLGTFLASGTSGCGQGCNDVGCESELTIELKPVSGTLKPGSYELTVETPYETGQFSCEISTNTTSACTSQPPASTIDAGGDPSGIGISVGGNPMSATVSLARGGQLLATQSFTPQYESFDPGGPDGTNCDPCKVANETMSIP